MPCVFHVVGNNFSAAERMQLVDYTAVVTQCTFNDGFHAFHLQHLLRKVSFKMAPCIVVLSQGECVADAVDLNYFCLIREAEERGLFARDLIEALKSIISSSQIAPCESPTSSSITLSTLPSEEFASSLDNLYESTLHFKVQNVGLLSLSNIMDDNSVLGDNLDGFSDDDVDNMEFSGEFEKKICTNKIHDHELSSLKFVNKSADLFCSNVYASWS